ncbi:FST3 [Cyberlindnera jadinii]|uniref:FST3 protein n=1 Tax=Cyberlindnera jadinii (strain ATCC 18201 / CBS 1600 / BCRC 20928 / JCM 3617 / NBRC 0987 / NRRL Y-1542) TaxID=983966 RepID=A0A0H5C055_CYBJN|nr:FST3 [Cyberlindnera jadinii]
MNTKREDKKRKASVSTAVASRKRNRVPISCTICRRRKVKCDKKRPICTACEKTGVAHLCHYIDPPWAQPLSNDELHPEALEEMEKLKEKIQELEAQLNDQRCAEDDLGGTGANEQETLSDSDGPGNEPLNLAKKFDMLHIKSTTTTHLGATSWLAIMKGDPYLRVLWAHIFKVRKQVEEYKHRRHIQQHQVAQVTGTGTVVPANVEQPILVLPRGECPVARARPLKELATEVATCPAHRMKPSTSKQPEVDSTPLACPVSGKTAPAAKCPVSRSANLQGDNNNQSTRDGCNEQADNGIVTDQEEDDEEERVCPLMIGDNSFLNSLDSNSEHHHKHRKSTRSNSNDSSKSETRKVSPEDFKSDPVTMMQKYLPKKKILWLFIERYFEVLYVYLPYVDEKEFREEVTLIMGGPDDEEQDIKIKIRHGVDFALIGTVCIILRLVWNTLPMNNSNKLLGKSVNTKTYYDDPKKVDLMQKKENEVPLELIDCVKHCFSNLKLMRKSSLKIVQCSLFLRMYFMYSPEDGDGADGADSQIFLGMLIQMAMGIGLHRDPQNFENFGDERQRHLWRKVWYTLISLDVSQSVNLGCPRVLQNYQEFSDTMLPCEESVADNDFKELTVIKNIHAQAKLDDILSRTMDVLLNVHKPAKRFHVDLLINELQNSISGFGVSNDKNALPQLGKILVNRSRDEPLYSSGTRAIQMRAHVTVNMLIYLLNYILYVHFEPRGSMDPKIANIAKTYAQKALNCALEGYRNCTLFFDCGLDYFGPGADLILAPQLLTIGHRSMQFMVSLILRSRCGPFMKPAYINEGSQITRTGSTSGILPTNYHHRNHDLDHIEIKDESEQYSSAFHVDVNSGETLATILLGHMDKFHDLAQKLGDKYAYSWRMAKAVGFFIILLRKPTNVVKSMVKTDNLQDVENDTGEVSNMLNSVPLVLSSDEQQFKKCPMYSPETSATRSTVAQQSNESSPADMKTPRTRASLSGTKVESPEALSSIAATPQAGTSPMDVMKPTKSSVTAFPSLNGVDLEMPDFTETMLQPGFMDGDKSIGDIFDMLMSNSASMPAPGSTTTNGGAPSTSNADINPLNFNPNDYTGNMDFSSMMNGGWFT